MKVINECASHVISFDNLDDSLSDAHKNSPQGPTADASLPPPLITPD
jgi:hypothetical protein